MTVLYEADADAIDGIHAANRDAIVIPACLAETDSEQTLYLTVNPGASSLLKPTAMWNDRYVPIIGVDFDFPGGAEIVEERKLMARSLDSLLASLRDRLPPPDFLSLDIQGYEHAVLKGARDALRRSICGLIVEVEFVQMYQGQCRFQDVCDLLDQFGFVFVRFLTIGELSGPRAPLGFRSAGYQSWADALFLRRPQHIRGDRAGVALYKKLAFFAVVFGIVDLAVECFDLLRKLGPVDAVFNPVEHEYEKFLLGLFNSYERAVKILPPAFSEMLPAERRLLFSRAPGLDDWPEILDGLQNYCDGNRKRLPQLQAAADTEFEAILREYGFADLAERVKLVRRDQSSKLDATIKQANSISNAG